MKWISCIYETIWWHQSPGLLIFREWSVCCISCFLLCWKDGWVDGRMDGWISWCVMCVNCSLSHCCQLFSHELNPFTLLPGVLGRSMFRSWDSPSMDYLPPEHSKDAFTEQLAFSGWGEEGSRYNFLFHFQFFGKKGLPLVFGKCVQSNYQLWSRRDS